MVNTRRRCEMLYGDTYDIYLHVYRASSSQRVVVHPNAAAGPFKYWAYKKLAVTVAFTILYRR